VDDSREARNPDGPDRGHAPLKEASASLLSRWPGRIAVHSARSLIRTDIFDRSMTIAAQFFTSVLPILILFATWVQSRDVESIANAVSMPEESRSVLEDAVQSSTSAAFGIVGTLIVLVSATSLSRALTRAFAAIWALPRPKSRLSSAWRWLAAVMVLALSVFAVRSLSELASGLPAGGLWHVMVSLTCDVAVALFVPWVLLSGVVHPRMLAPGALFFALVCLVGRPASAEWFPRALESSAEQYGSIGVAFTYLAWLYVVSLCLLATAVVGREVAMDPAALGRSIRGDA
jgi:membrane protein